VTKKETNAVLTRARMTLDAVPELAREDRIRIAKTNRDQAVGLLEMLRDIAGVVMDDRFWNEKVDIANKAIAEAVARDQLREARERVKVEKSANVARSRNSRFIVTFERLPVGASLDGAKWMPAERVFTRLSEARAFVKKRCNLQQYRALRIDHYTRAARNVL
jgi:hypothetical protein